MTKPTVLLVAYSLRPAHGQPPASEAVPATVPPAPPTPDTHPHLYTVGGVGLLNTAKKAAISLGYNPGPDVRPNALAVRDWLNATHADELAGAPLRVIGFNPRRFLRALAFDCGRQSLSLSLPAHFWRGCEAVDLHEFAGDDPKTAVESMASALTPEKKSVFDRWRAEWGGLGVNMRHDLWLVYHTALAGGYFW